MSASYVVKELRNPWGLPRWEDWLAEAFRLELRAIAAGVRAPEPVANPEGGGCLARVPRRDGSGTAPVRVHHWVDGRPLAAGPVSADVAAWAGRVLATLHGLAVKPADRLLFPVPSTDTAARWPGLARAARRSGAPWAGQLAEAGRAVAVMAALAQAAGHRPDEEVMTHGDIDQKNILITRDGPVLCDWDVASPLVPRREVADVAVSMAGWRDFAVARAVIRAYRQAGGDDTPIQPADLGQPLMVSLDWVALNVQRAIGQRPASAAEAELARELLPGLLAGLPAKAETALHVVEILEP